MKEYTVAVVGATGVVGKEIIDILGQRNFPVKKIVPLASERSEGSVVVYNDASVRVKRLEESAFEGVDFALFSAGGSVSEEWVPKAVKKGVICIDNTSHFRMHKDVPLVVPEVNEADLAWHKGIIANPNCSTAQLVVVLKPIYERYGIKRLVISTYQSVSGAGKKAIDDLEQQTRANMRGADFSSDVFSHPIAFNLIPQIDVFEDNGYTKEEMKLVNETRKILGDKSLPISATAVRVPVFVSHSEAVNIETNDVVDIQELKELLDKAPGVSVKDDPASQTYPTPREISGEDDVFVGRIRQDISNKHGINLWCVGDNLRKGAALNAVQIAECLIKK